MILDDHDDITRFSTITYVPFLNDPHPDVAVPPPTPYGFGGIVGRTWQALGKVCPSPSIPFTDVSSGSYTYGPITCISGLGITTGTSPTTYSPDDLVTRGQMAAFIARTIAATATA